jgi:hypothetical protein
MGLFGWLSGTDKYGAAQSALIAKYMYNQMSPAEREDIRLKAIEVLQYGGFPPEYAAERIDRLNELERFCLYSTTMAMAGIPPALKGILYNDEWYPIKNPFVALIKADKQLMAAQYEIHKKHGIRISLSL